jgi:hypothetical protein
MGFNTENAKEAKGCIATKMEGVLLFITIIPRIPYLLELSKTFFKQRVGLKTI